MNGKVQRQRHQRPTATARRRQALLVRAVVGSLVLCAALAPQTLAQDNKPHDNQIQLAHSRQLRELLTEVRKLVKLDDFDLNKTVDIAVEAEAVGNAEDDPLHYVKITCSPETDQFWGDVVSRAVVALRSSNAQQVLKGAQHVSLKLRLDGQYAGASVIATFDSEVRASQLADGYNGLLAFARSNRRNADVALVLNNMTVSANGKQLSMLLEMPREQAGNLLRKHLSLP